MGNSNPGPVDPALAKLGFTRIKPVRIKRITMEVSGLTKTGKTRLGLTMPQPIGLINTDRSLTDVLPEFPNVDVSVIDLSGMFNEGEELSQGQAKAIEQKFSAAYRALLAHPRVRSVVVDKWTAMWEVARYAEFGKASVKAHHYVPVNLRMRGYLTAVQNTAKNVLLIQDTKEEWINEKPTGRLIVDGFKYTPSLVQVNAQMRRESPADEDAGFRLAITGCGVNADLMGWEFENEDINWPKIGSMALTDTKMSDWK